MLESVRSVRLEYGAELRIAEWVFTVLFTVEYAARMWSVQKPATYARSFFGVVDLLAVLPSYLSALFPGGQVLAVVRILRVVRVFRILKLAQFVGEANVLGAALRSARFKITVFMISVVSIVVVVGAMMYLVEGPEAGFTSIPKGMYWAIVTLTTVGYGDIAPTSSVGQALAAVVMIMGYAIIAVPTGIVTVELSRQGLPPAAPGGGAGAPVSSGAAPPSLGPALDNAAMAAAGAPGNATRAPPGAPELPTMARACIGCEHVESNPAARFCKFCGTSFPPE